MEDASIPSPPDSSDASGRRTVVVLAGRTGDHGADTALRGDSEIELIRARSAVGALGELADAHRGSSELDLTVVVAPGLIAADRAGAFANAARRIAEDVRLLGIGADTPDGFDCFWPGGADPDRLRRLVKREGPEPAPAAPSAAQEVAAIPMPAQPSFSASPVPASGAALSPAAALATGRDPVEALLAGLRAAWPGADIQLRHGAAETDPGLAITPVLFEGREVGQLLSPAGQLPAEVLARSAADLAPWIVLAQQQEQLRHAAFTDELTGAWNRRYFTRFLAEAIRQATLRRHTVTLLVFDVDDFKRYNDQYSHAAGDVILTETVRLLNACIRATDRVCRIGGDEFAVIFHDPEGPRGPAGGPTSPQSIGQIVRRFQAQILQHRFPKLLELAPGTLTISGGMATFPWDGRTVSQLLDKADALAIQSKRQGKKHITLGPGAEQVCGEH